MLQSLHNYSTGTNEDALPRFPKKTSSFFDIPTFIQYIKRFEIFEDSFSELAINKKSIHFSTESNNCNRQGHQRARTRRLRLIGILQRSRYFSVPRWWQLSRHTPSLTRQLCHPTGNEQNSAK